MKFRAITYNMHKGRSFFLRKRNLKELEELLQLFRPDFVFLQELLRDPHAEELLERLADSFWPYHAYGKNAFAGDYHYGNGMLSKYPFKEVEQIDISTNPLEKRGILYGLVSVKEKPIHLFCTHFDLTPWGRKNQFQKVRAIIHEKAKKTEAVILGGDFNDWQENLSFKKLGLLDSFKEVHGYAAKTAPSVYPIFALDRLYSRKLKIEQASVIRHHHWLQLSDHLPLCVDFDYAASPRTRLAIPGHALK